MNSSLLLVVCLVLATVCAQTHLQPNPNPKLSKASVRANSGPYVHDGVSPVVSNVGNATYSVLNWGSDGGTLYYGILVTNLASVSSFSFYLSGLTNMNGVYASDVFAGQIYDSDGVSSVSTKLWEGNFTLSNAVGPSVRSVTLGSNVYAKVSASLSTPLALNPSKTYYFTFFVVQTAQQYRFLESVYNGGSLYYMNAGAFPYLANWADGYSVTFEIESKGRIASIDVISATSVPTSGGVTTITGTFGNSVSVFISGQPCVVISFNSNTIQCQAPAGTRENNSLTVFSANQTVTKNIFSYYDVNECAMANTCAAGFTCVNTYGSFICVDSNSGLFCQCSSEPTVAPTQAPTPTPTLPPTQPPTPPPSPYFQLTNGNGVAIALGNANSHAYLKTAASNPSDWTQHFYLIRATDVNLGTGYFIVSRAAPSLNFDVTTPIKLGSRLSAWERKASQSLTANQRFDVDFVSGVITLTGNGSLKVGISGTTVVLLDAANPAMLQVVPV